MLLLYIARPKKKIRVDHQGYTPTNIFMTDSFFGGGIFLPCLVAVLAVGLLAAEMILPGGVADKVDVLKVASTTPADVQDTTRQPRQPQQAAQAPSPPQQPRQPQQDAQPPPPPQQQASVAGPSSSSNNNRNSGSRINPLPPPPEQPQPQQAQQPASSAESTGRSYDNVPPFEPVARRR